MFASTRRLFAVLADIPIVYNSISDRWFVINKLPGWSLTNHPHYPSVTQASESFAPNAKLFFPFTLGVDNHGLVPIATDPVTCSIIKKLFKDNAVRLTFRVLADVTHPPRDTQKCQSTKRSGHWVRDSPLVCDFHSNYNEVKRSGSLWNDEGTALLAHGFIKSFIRMRPMRLRASHPLQENVVMDAERIADRIHHTLHHPMGSFHANVASDDSVEHTLKQILLLRDYSKREAQALLHGERVPIALRNMISKSIMARSCRESETHLGLRAITEFQLISTAKHLQLDGTEKKTGLYHVKKWSNAPHQIQVHFSESGCPVLGDVYYHPAHQKKRRRYVPDVPASLDEDHRLNGQKSGISDPFGMIPVNSEELNMIGLCDSAVSSTTAVEPPTSAASKGFQVTSNDNCKDQSNLENSKEQIMLDPSIARTKEYLHAMGVQLFALELPDPLHTGRHIRLRLSYPPQWSLIHPQKFERDICFDATESEIEL